MKSQDICLDTGHYICHSVDKYNEIHPYETSETAVVYNVNECVHMRTFCDSIFTDSTTVEICNHWNICNCNLIEIVGCDLNFWASVTIHQQLQSNYRLFQMFCLPPLEWNFCKNTIAIWWLEYIAEENPKQRSILINIYLHKVNMHHILERLEWDEEHKWWDISNGNFESKALSICGLVSSNIMPIA